MKEKYKDILKKVTVLIVDDDKKLREIFKKTIHLYVNNVYEASNGNDALNIYNDKKPNIVITDIKMPLMDGLMLTSILRQLNKKLPILIISAYSEPETLVNLIPLKLTNYLIKPIDFDQLKLSLVKCAIEIEENGEIEAKLTNDSSYSYSKKRIIHHEEDIHLTPNEILLIELLLEHENKLVPINLIEYNVYKNAYVSITAINTLISKLRKKIGKNIIKSIPSHGYIMVKEI